MYLMYAGFCVHRLAMLYRLCLYTVYAAGPMLYFVRRRVRGLHIVCGVHA